MSVNVYLFFIFFNFSNNSLLKPPIYVIEKELFNEYLKKERKKRKE